MQSLLLMNVSLVLTDARLLQVDVRRLLMDLNLCSGRQSLHQKPFLNLINQLLQTHLTDHGHCGAQLSDLSRTHLKDHGHCGAHLTDLSRTHLNDHGHCGAHLSDLSRTHLKDHGHCGAHLNDLRVWQAQLLVVVKDLQQKGMIPNDCCRPWTGKGNLNHTVLSRVRVRRLHHF